MQKKKVIQKVLVLAAWIVVGCGMITLLAAANHKQAEHSCKEIVVSIKGSGEKYYVEKNDILSYLKKSVGSSLVGKPLSTINLSKLEKVLLKNSWIEEAQLYFDGQDVLHVIVMEREPIARVFTTAGESFYMDSAGTKMPLLNKVSIRLPVVTNFMAPKLWNEVDSALVKDITSLLAYINSDPFWKAQIAQIDIRPEGRLELIPVIGNHIVKLGKAEEVEQKLHNLLLFYKQIISKTGFDVYKVIDVQYAGQVIGVKTNPTAAIDSIQLQKNIETLIEKTKQQALNDSLFSEKITQFVKAKDSVNRKLDSIISNPTPSEKPRDATVAPKPTTVKPIPSIKSKAEVKPKAAKPAQKPRAVMQRKNEY